MDHVITAAGGFEEVVLHLDGPEGRVEVPLAVVVDRGRENLVDEMRIYCSVWAQIGRHVHRPPLLQEDPELRLSDVVGEYQRALAEGDAAAVVATFEDDGYVREPAGGTYVHQGSDGLHSFFDRRFSNGGGILLERCRAIDDGHRCALEYNVVRWGATELPPEAGVAVHVRGEGGKLAAVRSYDDADPPSSASP